MGSSPHVVTDISDKKANEQDEEATDAIFAPLGRSEAAGFEERSNRFHQRRRNQLLEQRVIAGFDDDSRVEPYRQLRTQLLQRMHDSRWSTLALTSAHEGAGKTLTAVNLALSIARDPNHSVLLVDLDLRTPTVHEKLGLDVPYALVDYLQGTCTLEDAVLRGVAPRLSVLAGRPLEHFSSELLASVKMKTFMANLLGTYDPSRITIFDLPPLLRNDDALLFAPLVNAVLMVVEDGVTTADQLDHSLALLRNANVVGTLLNKARG